MRNLLGLAIAFSIAASATAEADTFVIQVGGICSTQFIGGNGGGYLGYWPGITSINAGVNQNDSMVNATNDMTAVLDTYCSGSNYCYIAAYSNGSAVISRTLSMVKHAWNIAYIANSGSNEGGSQLGGTGWLGEVFGGCYLAGHIGPSDNRNGWNHNDTNGLQIGGIGGDGWLAPYAQSAVLPGDDDGAVSTASAGGNSSSSGVGTLCEGAKYTNHVVWWSCEYGDLNHYDLKMKAICNLGGASGCPN